MFVRLLNWRANQPTNSPLLVNINSGRKRRYSLGRRKAETPQMWLQTMDKKWKECLAISLFNPQFLYCQSDLRNGCVCVVISIHNSSLLKWALISSFSYRCLSHTCRAWFRSCDCPTRFEGEGGKTSAVKSTRACENIVSLSGHTIELIEIYTMRNEINYKHTYNNHVRVCTVAVSTAMIKINI